MRIPERLKIGGHEVVVEFAPLQDAVGESLLDENKIRIDPSIAQSQKEAALIHEILHFINTTMDGRDHFGHALLDSLSEQLYQVLSDNDMLR